MRANQFLPESAADELAKKLPTLKKHDYNAIDALMQDISFRHKLTGERLHDLFVSKYGHTPDTWVKRIKSRLGETDVDPTDNDDDSMGYMKYFSKPQEPKKQQQKVYRGWDEYEHEKELEKQQNPQMSESVDGPDDIQKIKEFITWSFETLNMQKPYPRIRLSKDTEQAQKDHRTGVHTEDGSIEVYVGNRNLIDIFRTLFHEFVHHRQDQLGMIKEGDSYPGSPIEAMADMMAGKYIKIYGKEHPEIFQ